MKSIGIRSQWTVDPRPSFPEINQGKIFTFRPTALLLCKKHQKHTQYCCLRTPTCVPSTPSVSNNDQGYSVSQMYPWQKGLEHPPVCFIYIAFVYLYVLRCSRLSKGTIFCWFMLYYYIVTCICWYLWLYYNINTGPALQLIWASGFF